MTRIFLIAGEASGDALGAALMRALKAERPDIEFSGIGGSRMAEEGLKSFFPMEELSVMGVAEVLPRLRHILNRIRQTAEEILRTKPDAVVTIDSPDFCFRVVKKAKAAGGKGPFIHYVAPSVWAWRPGRAKKVAGFLDHLLALLPFEPPYFKKHGLATTFVGHSIVEREQRGDAARFRKKHLIRDNQKVFCVLPGSRMSELTRLLPGFSKAIDNILREHPELVVVIPTLPHLRPYLQQSFKGKGINPLFVEGDEDKFDCFAASTVALAASGTVSLELALTETPHIITYRLNALTAWLVKRMVKTPYANLVNILLQRPLVPELIQEDCTPASITHAVLRLLENENARNEQARGFREALTRLGRGAAETPGQKAAKAVLSVIQNTGGAA